MKLSQEIKDSVDVSVQRGYEFTTSYMFAEIAITGDDRHKDGTVRVNLPAMWVSARDALELSVFFKKLAKKLPQVDAA